jgi:hypothetical protein
MINTFKKNILILLEEAICFGFLFWLLQNKIVFKSMPVEAARHHKVPLYRKETLFVQ